MKKHMSISRDFISTGMAWQLRTTNFSSQEIDRCVVNSGLS